MSLRKHTTELPHINWVDLNNDGTLVEVAVLKEDAAGNIFFIRIDALDEIDKQRLVKIVRNRNATNFELWDLMSQVTLGNGMNALTYFHQLAKMRTATGKVMTPSLNKMGAPINQMQPKAGTSEE